MHNAPHTYAIITIRLFERREAFPASSVQSTKRLRSCASSEADCECPLYCGEGDHVHCFVSAPPKLSITAIVKYLKGITGRKLFERFPEIRNQLWKGELWNHSYYVETIGSVSEENIRRYMEHQSKSY